MPFPHSFKIPLPNPLPVDYDVSNRATMQTATSFKIKNYYTDALSGVFPVPGSLYTFTTGIWVNQSGSYTDAWRVDYSLSTDNVFLYVTLNAYSIDPAFPLPAWIENLDAWQMQFYVTGKNIAPWSDQTYSPYIINQNGNIILPYTSAWVNNPPPMLYLETIYYLKEIENYPPEPILGRNIERTKMPLDCINYCIPLLKENN